MKKIRYILIFLLLTMLSVHPGCMKSETTGRGGVAGMVTNSYGEPLSGVKVSCPDGSTISDYYGHWLIESLPAQTTELTASRQDYQTQVTTVEVVSGETRDNILFALASDGDVFDVRVSEVTSTSAKVIFYTRQKAVGFVKYGRSALLEEATPSDTEALFTHQYQLNNLIPASTYRLRCMATDEHGRLLQSELISFNTEATLRPEAPADLVLSRVANSNVINLAWSTNIGADQAGYQVYRAESAAGPFVAVGTVSHSNFADNNVYAGIKYYYRVTQLAGSGEESSPSAVASFVLPGVMSINAIWKAQNSPYNLDGDLIVAPGVSLSIDKGTKVNLVRSSGAALSEKPVLQVQGALLVQGTASEPVVFTSDSGSPVAGDWYGIVFDVAADLGASMIKGLHLSFAEYGLDGIAGLPQVINSRFTNCRVAGVRSRAARAELVLENNFFDSCASGMLIQENAVNVSLVGNQVVRCVYGIVCRDNKYAKIEKNHISFSGVSGLDVGNLSESSIVRRNVVGWGSTGTGLICRGNDEVRRNTLHANIGIEIRDTAQAVIRSNLLLTDKSRNGLGVLYTGAVPYNFATASKTVYIQNNAIWNLTEIKAKYANSDGNYLPASADINLPSAVGPALAGGDPFTEFPSMSFSYVPVKGTPLFGQGYDGETIGAEDVP